MHFIDDDFVNHFCDLFISRVDTYGLQKLKGYIRVDEPLVMSVLMNHFLGKETIGTYSVNPSDDTVKNLAFDVDPEHCSDPLQTTKTIYNQARDRFPPSSVLVEASRWEDPSFHVWTFFQPSLPAKCARFLGLKVLEHTGVTVEVFPKQDTVREGFGNLLKLPLGLHQRARKWSYFVDPEKFEPLPSYVLLDVHGCGFPERDLQQMLKIAEQMRGIQTKLTRTDPLARDLLNERLSTGKPYRGRDPPCILTLLKGVPEGWRNTTCVKIASYLLTFRRLSPQKVLSDLLDWNKRNLPPMSEWEVHTVMESETKRGYRFGCGSFQDVCSPEDCPLLRQPSGGAVMELAGTKIGHLETQEYKLRG